MKLMNPDFSVIASWPIPNYVNPTRRGPGLWVTVALTLFLAVAAVALRLYGRIFIRRWVGLDDLLVGIAMISFLGISTIVCLANGYWDWDRHVWDMPLTHVSPAKKSLYIARLLFTLSSATARLSVLCLYYRLVRSAGSKSAIRVLHCVTTFCISLFLVSMLASAFTCRPANVYWHFPMTYGDCVNDGVLTLFTSAANTGTEFLTAILPISGIIHFGVDRKQRLEVFALFSLGFLTTITGALRTFYVWKIDHTWDMTWWSFPHWICAEIEICLALVSACAPPLRPLLGRLVLRLYGTESPARQQNGKQENDTQATTLNSDQASLALSESDWQRSMLRTVDIEGIRDDEFGYTIHITGPERDSALLRLWPGTAIKRRNLRKRGVSMQHGKSCTSEAETREPPKVGIEARTSVHLTEGVRRSPLQRGDGKRDPGPSQTHLSWESAVDCASLGLVDHGLLGEASAETLAVGDEKNPVNATIATSDDNRSSEPGL